jgi:hypothetical protein
VSLKLSVIVGFKEDDPLHVTLRRLTYRGEKAPRAVKRALTRYNQVLESTNIPNSIGISRLSQIIIEVAPETLGGIDYPNRSVITSIVKRSSNSSSDIEKICDWIDSLNGIEFLKLIEAIEQIYVGK